jgi:hypothetical protein
VDLLNAGMRDSGVYYLQIRGTTYWFLKVFCEQEVADGGWTVSRPFCFSSDFPNPGLTGSSRSTFSRRYPPQETRALARSSRAQEASVSDGKTTFNLISRGKKSMIVSKN